MNTEEYPPYITTTKLLGHWYAVKMEHSSRAGDYSVTDSRKKDSKGEAMAEAIDWARKEGIEYR